MSKENYIHEIEQLKRETIELIKQIYKKEPVGGALHIVLDDDNVADHHILWCLQSSIINEEFCDKADREMFERCAVNLLKLGTKGRRRYCIDKAFSEMYGERSENGKS